MSTSPIATLIQGHDDFFSRIIGMIPSDLYRPPAVDPVIANSKFYKHRRMPLQPNERKLLSKQHKLKKYNPDYQEPEDGDDESEGNEDEKGEIEDDGEGIGDSNSEKSVDEIETKQSTKNVEDLRQRLKKKLSTIKNDVNAKKLITKPPTATQVIVKSNSNKANVENDIREQLMQTDNYDPIIDANEETVETGDIDFSLGYGSNIINKRKGKDIGKPGSKLKRLHQMAEEVEKKRQRIEAYKSQGESGKALLDQERWSDVIASASGERAVIDGSKVKKALKRIEKAKAKSSKEWKARIEEVANSKQAKLEKREQNLQARRQGIKIPGQSNQTVKPSGEDSSRSGRAGFEGKKTDFLNPSKPAAKK